MRVVALVLACVCVFAVSTLAASDEQSEEGVAVAARGGGALSSRAATAHGSDVAAAWGAEVDLDEQYAALRAALVAMVSGADSEGGEDTAAPGSGRSLLGKKKEKKKKKKKGKGKKGKKKKKKKKGKKKKKSEDSSAPPPALADGGSAGADGAGAADDEAEDAHEVETAYVMNESPLESMTSQHTPRAASFPVFRGRTQTNKIAITFDDGPSPDITPNLLDTLRELDMPATFYVVGMNVEEHPAMFQRMFAEGHLVGSHTHGHEKVSSHSAAEVAGFMQKGEELFHRYSGSRTYLMRPPYGAVSGAAGPELRRLGYVIANWNMDSQDWREDNPTRLFQIVNGRMMGTRGGILLFHERFQTLVILPMLRKACDELGIEIVPLTYFFDDNTNKYLADAYNCDAPEPLLQFTCNQIKNPLEALPDPADVEELMTRFDIPRTKPETVQTIPKWFADHNFPDTFTNREPLHIVPKRKGGVVRAPPSSLAADTHTAPSHSGGMEATVHTRPKRRRPRRGHHASPKIMEAGAGRDAVTASNSHGGGSSSSSSSTGGGGGEGNHGANFVASRRTFTSSGVGASNMFVNGNAVKGKVALTFDDGPSPDITPNLLDTLRDLRWPATFYVVGLNFDNHPDMVARMLAEGHLVGSHTYGHAKLSKASAETVRDEMERGEKNFERFTGSRSYLMRPPYGATGKIAKQELDAMSYVIANWNMDSEDWREDNPEALLRIVRRRLTTSGGGVLLFHERFQTLEILRSLKTVLDELSIEVVPLSYFFTDTTASTVHSLYGCHATPPTLLEHTCRVIEDPSVPLPPAAEVSAKMRALAIPGTDVATMQKIGPWYDEHGFADPDRDAREERIAARASELELHPERRVKMWSLDGVEFAEEGDEEDAERDTDNEEDEEATLRMLDASKEKNTNAAADVVHDTADGDGDDDEEEEAEDMVRRAAHKHRKGKKKKKKHKKHKKQKKGKTGKKGKKGNRGVADAKITRHELRTQRRQQRDAVLTWIVPGAVCCVVLWFGISHAVERFRVRGESAERASGKRRRKHRNK